jgi:pSer/pThr/pTyr-binding forkhead associated (FHA) protein/uncharacterized protein YdcH (DUF465 family)
MEYTITSKTPDKLEEKLAQYKKLTALHEDLNDRLAKAEAQKESVSPKIYEKVKSEYDRKLGNVQEQLSPIVSGLNSARQECEEELPRLEEEIREIEDELAEAEFRCRVGEFAQTKLTEIQTRLNPDLAERSERHEYFTKRLKLIDADFETSAPEDDDWDSDEPVDPEVEETADDGNSSRVTLSADDPLEALTDRPDDGPEESDDEEAPAPDQDPYAADSDAEAEMESEKTSFENPQEWIDELGDLKTGVKTSTKKTADKKPTAEKEKDDPLSALADPLGDPADEDASVSNADRPEREEVSVGFPNMVIITGPSSGKKIPLLPMTMSIGREHDNNIELKDPDVGRYHSRILYDRGRFVLEDLESSNGTWLNGEKISEAALKNGDRIKIGGIELAIDFD